MYHKNAINCCQQQLQVHSEKLREVDVTCGRGQCKNQQESLPWSTAHAAHVCCRIVNAGYSEYRRPCDQLISFVRITHMLDITCRIVNNFQRHTYIGGLRYTKMHEQRPEFEDLLKHREDRIGRMLWLRKVGALPPTRQELMISKLSALDGVHGGEWDAFINNLFTQSSLFPIPARMAKWRAI